MRPALAILVCLPLPMWSCQLLPQAHGGPPLELSMDTAEPPPGPVQVHPWPVQTQVDPQTGRFELTWDSDASAQEVESIPIDAVYRVELARAYGPHPDELFVHLVNSRRILISRGDPVATQAAVLTTWLDKPVTELPAGEGHLDWAESIERPPPTLVVLAAGGMLDIQPLSDDVHVQAPTTSDASSEASRSPSSTSGHGRREDIDRTIKTHMPRFRSCYQRQLQRNPRLEGGVVMEITIGVDGSVSQALVVESSLRDPIVEKCIADELIRLEFPAPSGGQLVVSYPFAFSRS